MDRSSYGCGGGPSWPQGPSDPVYQRNPPPSAYPTVFGNPYDNFGTEDSWRSRASDSWRDDRFNRGAEAASFEDHRGWKSSLLRGNSLDISANQFSYVHQPEFPKISERRAKLRGRGRHRRYSDRPPREKEFNKAKLCDDGTENVIKESVVESYADNKSGVLVESDDQGIQEDYTGKQNDDSTKEKECENNDAKKESYSEQQTGLSAEEESPEAKSPEANQIDSNENKDLNKPNEKDDFSKKLIIRRDLTHDDIHHFKPIPIRDTDDKTKTKGRREPGWVLQWEINNAAIKESTSKSGNGLKAGSLLNDTDSGQIGEDSLDNDEKLVPKASSLTPGSIVDPQQYVEELSNPDLSDPQQVDDLVSELSPKRKKTLSSTEEDWRVGAKTTLLGPFPFEGRRTKSSELQRPPKPCLLSRPPLKSFYEEVEPRRPLKPGLLDGPYREACGPRPYFPEDDYGNSVGRVRNGPVSASLETLPESALELATASLSKPGLIPEVAKKGLEELLLSNNTIKAKINELYSEEIKKILLEKSKGEGEQSVSQPSDKNINEPPLHSVPRAGKALLGAPPGRKPESLLPINGFPNRFEEINRGNYYGGSPDALWKDCYGSARSASFDTSADYCREGPSQKWRDIPYGDPHDYRQHRIYGRERFGGSGTWPEHANESLHFRDRRRERREQYEHDERVSLQNSSSHARSPYTGVPDAWRYYGPNKRFENRKWDYEELVFNE